MDELFEKGANEKFQNFQVVERKEELLNHEPAQHVISENGAYQWYRERSQGPEQGNENRI